MPAAILSIVGPMIPYILGILAVVGLYLGIKQKGVQQERVKQQEAQAKAVQQVQQKVQVAVAKDVDIDKQVQDDIKVREKATSEIPVASAPDKFKF